MSFSEKLREHRKRLLLTQATLAEKLGVSTKTVANWEQGNGIPRFNIQQQLIDALGTTIQELDLEERIIEDVPLNQSVLNQEKADTNSSQRFRTSTDHDPDWDRMLLRLQRSYKELLNQSLHDIAWIELDLVRRPDLVRNVTNLLYRLPQGGERLLPHNTSIIQVYDEAEGELLILGAPGAGKSTLLLDLAQHLVARAQSAEISLLPVILQLSSWALERSAIADWMTEQLSQVYNVPRQLSKNWVAQGRVLALLDGLDEVEEHARPDCITAINEYHQTHLAPLVVCSRQTEYEGSLKQERLVLQDAIIVQPLANEQIEAYLSVAGPSFDGVRAALYEQQELWKLAITPLMLSVLLLAYRDIQVEDILKQKTDLEQQVWQDYVTRQVQEKGHSTHYPLHRTGPWLMFLAQRMRQNQQTTFYAEHLHLGWLGHLQGRVASQFVTHLPSLLIGFCVIPLIYLFLVGSTDPTTLYHMAIFGGFTAYCMNRFIVAEPDKNGKYLPPTLVRQVCIALLFGVLLTMGLGLIPPQPGEPPYTLSDWMREGSIFLVGSLLSGLVFQILLNRPQRSQSTVSRTPFDIQDRYFWQAVISFGIIVAVMYIIDIWLDWIVVFGVNAPVGAAIVGVNWAVIIIVGTVLIRFILKSSFGTLSLAEPIHWTWNGLFWRKHLWRTARVMITFFLIYGLNNAFIDGWSLGLGHAPVSGLAYGLNDGVSIGLIYWVILGLYQGMKQEHLDDQRRFQFNQGIRYTLRNSFVIGLISTIIIVLMSVLMWVNISLFEERLYGPGKYYGLLAGIHRGLNVGLWVFVPALVVMWALSGGLIVLRHYAIRWLLARHRLFPFRAQAFLDDANQRILMRRVGGGYSFIHRRLQDYFADSEDLIADK